MMNTLRRSYGSFFCRINCHLKRSSGNGCSDSANLRGLTGCTGVFKFSRASKVRVPRSRPRVSSSSSIQSTVKRNAGGCAIDRVGHCIATITGEKAICDLSLVSGAASSGKGLVGSCAPRIMGRVSRVDSDA